MRNVFGACMCAVLLMLPAAVLAQQDESEIDRLRQTVEGQNRMIQELLRRIEAVEVTQDDQEEWIEADKSEKPLWSERMRLNGDFRYRYEYIDDGRKDDDRHRNRIRARLGVDAEILPTLDVKFQISTAGVVDADGDLEGDLASGNATLTNAWTSKNLWISQAYADWSPENVPGLNIELGKMKRPFITPVKNELIWDGDLNPEGAVVKYERDLGDSIQLIAHGYGFWVMERGSDVDTGLFGGQGALKHEFEHAMVLAGVSYYDFTNIEGQDLFIDDKNFGNTTDPTETMYAEDFDLFEVFGEVGFKAKGLPVALFGTYVTNTADDDEDTGWALGFKVGKAKKPGSWEFRYQYKKVEQDAVFGLFTDSDFGGGGTDAEGSEFNLAYQLAKNWQLAGTLFLNDVDVESKPEEDYTRAQLDVLFKF